MNVKNIGKTIYKLRRKNGLTQKELARMINVSDKAVSKWENGLGYPEISLLPDLSECLGVSVDYLLKSNSRSIAIAGNIITDVVNIIDKYPEKNMLATVLSASKAVGGCACNTAIDLAVMDRELFVSSIGKVGNDEYGRFVISEMQKYGVDTGKIIVSENESTGVTNVMSELETGERTFFYSDGSNRSFDIDDIDIENLDCEIFHIGYVCLLAALDKPDSKYGTRMARLLANIQRKGIKTSIDAISAQTENYAEKIIPVLKYCDYVIINEIESGMVTGLSPRNSDGTINTDNIKRTMSKFIEYGVKEKVIIHCTEAGFLMTGSGEFYVVPSLKLPEGYIKGSVGAGDAFAAGSLYGIYNKYDDKHILEFASSAAAANLSAVDSISGMKSKSEIEKIGQLYERMGLS